MYEDKKKLDRLKKYSAPAWLSLDDGDDVRDNASFDLHLNWENWTWNGVIFNID